MIPPAERLRISEVYASIQGESTQVGRPCVFVRLTGCNLRCVWCDSVFSFTGGEYRAIDDVVDEVMGFGLPLVEVTGGEPLVQKTAIPLMERLLGRGLEVMLETSGSRDIAPVPAGVRIIMDLKAPDSHEERANRMENLPLLAAKDELKIVLASRHDYEWARELIRAHPLPCPVLLSPVQGASEGGGVDGADLAKWMVEDRLPARLQIQVHKVLWPPDARGV
jgi:7-carboxy-7-deazaguanine synthase